MTEAADRPRPTTTWASRWSGRGGSPRPAPSTRGRWRAGRSSQAAVNLGVLLEKAGDLRGAAAAYAPAARDFPEDGLARRLGALYRQSGQLDEAWRLAREALLRDPASWSLTGP